MRGSGVRVPPAAPFFRFPGRPSFARHFRRAYFPAAHHSRAAFAAPTFRPPIIRMPLSPRPTAPRDSRRGGQHAIAPANMGTGKHGHRRTGAPANGKAPHCRTRRQAEGKNPMPRCFGHSPVWKIVPRFPAASGLAFAFRGAGGHSASHRLAGWRRKIMYIFNKVPINI